MKHDKRQQQILDNYYDNILPAILKEREEEKLERREHAFEVGFPCVIFGIVVGMIIAEVIA